MTCHEWDDCCGEGDDKLQCKQTSFYAEKCSKYSSLSGCHNHYKNDEEWHEGNQYCFWHEKGGENGEDICATYVRDLSKKLI